jgi:putative transposase
MPIFFQSVEYSSEVVVDLDADILKLMEDCWVYKTFFLFNVETGGTLTQKRQRKLQRFRNFDYAESGYYFITICVNKHLNFLGRIDNCEMVFNRYGEIVVDQWKWLQNHFSYVILDEWIVMPNHLHGIVIIDNNEMIEVGNGCDRSLPRVKSLSELIGAFKTTSSKRIHQAGLNDFAWQKSFYDHIIRNERSLNKIREYIFMNPVSWEIENGHLENIPFHVFVE